MLIRLLNKPDFNDTLSSVGLPMQDVDANDIAEFYGNINIEDKIKLMSRLVKAGPDHAKSIRGIWVTLAITAPRYFWSEMDTYTIGRQPLSSTSTMHKITSRNLTDKDFVNGSINLATMVDINGVINSSISNTDKIKVVKKKLPDGYLQTRILQFNYQALRNIYFQRRKHRLEEWKEFCIFIEKLDYADELITIK